MGVKVKKMSKIQKNVLNGTWIQCKSENIDKILEKMGFSWPVRKLAGVMSVTLVIDDDGIDGIRTEFKTVLKTSKTELSFDHEVYETGLTSNEKLTISPITLDNMTMKHTTHFEAPGITLDIDNTYVREGDTLTLTQIIDDVTGMRCFALKE